MEVAMKDFLYLVIVGAAYVIATCIFNKYPKKKKE